MSKETTPATETTTTSEPNVMKDAACAAAKVAHGFYLTIRTMPLPYVAVAACAVLPCLFFIPIALLLTPFVLSSVFWVYFLAFGATKTVSHSVETIESTFSVDIKENSYIKPVYDVALQGTWVIDQTMAPVRVAIESGFNIAIATVNQTWKTVSGSAEDLGKSISVKIGELLGLVWAYIAYIIKYVENVGTTYFPEKTKWAIEHGQIIGEKAYKVAQDITAQIKSNASGAVDAVKSKFA